MSLDFWTGCFYDIEIYRHFKVISTVVFRDLITYSLILVTEISVVGCVSIFRKEIGVHFRQLYDL